MRNNDLNKTFVALAAMALCACGSKTGGMLSPPPAGSGSCGGYGPHAGFMWTMPVAARKPLLLDATDSTPAGGGALTYSWSLASKPQGSAAQLPASGLKITFTPDVGGAYAVALTVSNSCGTNTVQWTVQAVEFAPTANAGPSTDYAAPAGTITLDGSASSDRNGDPLTFSWAMTAAPAGSAAAIANPSAAVSSFTPDLEGRYSFTLTVSDNTGLSSQSTTTIGIYHPAVALPILATDADYSAALDRILIATNEPALRIVNPHDGTFAAVSLDSNPSAVRVAPDGKTAVVSQYRATVGAPAHFAIVDLVTQRVTATYQPSNSQWQYDSGDVVLDGRGYAYAFPASSMNSPLIVNLGTSAVTAATANATAENSVFVKPVIDSTASNLYALGSNFFGLVRDTMSAGALAYSAMTQQSGTTSLYAGPFLAADGARLFTGDGQIWSPSTLSATGTLLAAGDTSTFTWIADSTGGGKIIAVKGGGAYGDDAFRLYDRSTLNLLAKKFWPGVIKNGVATWGTVRWAFWKADGSGYYVVFNGGIAAY